MNSAVNKREICNSDTLTGQKQNIKSVPEELGDPGYWNKQTKPQTEHSPPPQNPNKKPKKPHQKPTKKQTKEETKNWTKSNPPDPLKYHTRIKQTNFELKLRIAFHT